MLDSIKIAYFVHTIRSDWNNGNAHFQRGLMRSLKRLGHTVTIFEPEHAWSVDNLRKEQGGVRSLAEFERIYPDLEVALYSDSISREERLEQLRDVDVVILHEWNPPTLARQLLELRESCRFKLLFHDTHHRASSGPEQIAAYGLPQFDGVIVFGEALRKIYRARFGIGNVWTVHEGADTTIFSPSDSPAATDVVWIGNWGDGERSTEIAEYLLEPATTLRGIADYRIYGVRYPKEGLRALQAANVSYCGYLPNLSAMEVYAAAKMTVHVPRQQYCGAMAGIPTIRVFEALAAGIPLISAPWQDVEELFRPGDIRFVSNATEMAEAVTLLLRNPTLAAEQATRGREQILARHTCLHRAREVSAICEELLA